MKYDKIEIYKLKAFQFSNIKKLELTTKADMQIIIGSNGSGKSSLLREITPMPATRTDYEKTGYKILYLTHNKNKFIISSLFSNKTSPHSFIKNDIELNESGTTTVQEELLKTHLGYTRLIDDITTGKYKFAEMAPGIRKNILMSLNPFDIEFMYNIHKSISQNIRACKSNLSMLYDRKTILKTEILKSNDLKLIVDEQKETYKFVNILTELCIRTSEQINNIIFSGSTLFDVSEYKNTLSILKKNIINLGLRNKDNPELLIITINNSIISQTSKIETNDNSISTLVDELNNYNIRLEDIKHKEEFTSIENTVNVLYAKLKARNKNLTFKTTTSKEMLLSSYPLLEKLKNTLTFFMSVESSFMSNNHINRKKKYLDIRYNQLNLFKKLENDLLNKLNKLHDRMKISIDDIPKTNCGKMKCPLYVAFIAHNKSTINETIYLEKELSNITSKIARLKAYTNGISNQLNDAVTYEPHLNTLRDIIMSYPYIRNALSSLDIIKTLNSQPIIIYTKVLNVYNEIYNYYEILDLEKEYNSKLITFEKLKNIEDGEYHLLVSLMEDKNKTLNLLHIDNISIKNKLIKLNENKEILINYSNALSTVDDINIKLDIQLKEEKIIYEKDFLSKLLLKLNEQKTISVSRLGTIEHIIKEQDILKGRYDNEIIDQIKIIDKKLKELILLELALSPNSGIPYQYTARFINAIIETMNYYISTVFSYKFEVMQVEENTSLTYKFSAYVDDVFISDINTCSDAQKEMINLSFILATMKHLSLSDYPIFLDEVGRSFDFHHKHTLLNLLNKIEDEGLVSGLYLVNHVDAIISGISNADVLVLNEMNIIIPDVYNTHARITKT